MIEQKQTWRDGDTTVFLLAWKHGSVNIYIEHKSTYFEEGDKVMLGNLWVDEDYRRCCLGSHILEKSEEVVKREGFNSVILSYRKEAPEWLADWYKKSGYEFIKDDGQCIYVRKKLDKKLE